MKLQQSKLQNVRIGLYVLQAVLLFITMCVMFALFAQKDGKDGGSDGRNRYCIALVFLTIPAIIYQVGVPMWSRTQKFSSIYAFVSVDVILTILWLAAFASVASWVRAGVAQGATDAKISYGSANCTVFAYGTEQKCHLGNAATGFGVLIFLVFAATSALSIMFLMRMRRDTSPDSQKPWLAAGVQGDGYRPPDGNLEAGRQSKDRIWDSTYAGPDAEHDDDEAMHGNNHGVDQHDDYALLHATDNQDASHPGRRWEVPPMGPPVDTGYHGAPSSASTYHAPSALSPSGNEYLSQTDDYEDNYGAPSRYPPPRYSFTPGEPIPIPDPGEAGRRR